MLFDTHGWVNNEILTGSMCFSGFLSHKWIRFKDKPKKHQLCEDALTNVRAKRGSKKYGERDCVSVPLSRIKHVVGTKA